MTTDDVKTIQDASDATWRLSGSDLLALADPAGKIMAIHTKVKEVTLAEIQDAFTRSIRLPANQQWWFSGGTSLRGIFSADLLRPFRRKPLTRGGGDRI